MRATPHLSTDPTEITPRPVEGESAKYIPEAPPFPAAATTTVPAATIFDATMATTSSDHPAEKPSERLMMSAPCEKKTKGRRVSSETSSVLEEKRGREETDIRMSKKHRSDDLLVGGSTGASKYTIRSKGRRGSYSGAVEQEARSAFDASPSTPGVIEEGTDKFMGF